MSDARIESSTDTEAEPRREAQLQWQANSCSADSVRATKPESLARFREARRARYGEYGLWLRTATGIDGIRGMDVLEIGVGPDRITSPLQRAATASSKSSALL